MVTSAITILDETVLDTREAAAFARTTARTVVRWLTDGYPAGSGVVRLEGVRVGREWRTSREAVGRFLTAITPGATSPPPPPARTAADATLKRWGIRV